MNQPDHSDLIFDWAQAGARRSRWPAHVMLDDETLRDGLQSPSIIDPPVEQKVEILLRKSGSDAVTEAVPFDTDADEA